MVFYMKGKDGTTHTDRKKLLVDEKKIWTENFEKSPLSLLYLF